jgi:hypothetical protein
MGLKTPQQYIESLRDGRDHRGSNDTSKTTSPAERERVGAAAF